MPFLFCLPGPAAQRAQDGSPIRRAKNARRAPRLIAPPAAPAAAPTAPAAPAAPAAGRPRAAKARAVWQPHRARPRRKILLLAARRDPSPRLPRRRKKSGRPRLNSGQPHGRAMPQADRGPPKRAPYGSHAAPRPATKIVLLGARRAPRPHRPARHISSHNPANRAKIGQHPTGRTAPAPPQKQSGSSAPPSQSARPRPYGRGRVSVSPFRSFL